MKKKILCVVGTRPEVIKMAPVIYELRNRSWSKVLVLATAQHREMLDQMMKVFHLEADIDLNVMKHNQSLSELTANLVQKFDRVFSTEKPDLVLAQGDTTTVAMAALVAFYHKVPFGHVEAGLRSGDCYNPFPEEINRRLTAQMAQWHFAPTRRAKDNLLKEGIPETNIFVTGNTVIDALFFMLAKRNNATNLGIDDSKKLILVTVHRRESFGRPMENILSAISLLAREFNDISIVIPVHPNPNVRKLVYNKLNNQKNIDIVEPLNYEDFIHVLSKAYLILTDSGGIQEEAPALGKPVLVLREKTERPEAIEAGVAKLVGTKTEKIVKETAKLLNDTKAYREMAKGISPYGDGRAAIRIADILETMLAE